MTEIYGLYEYAGDADNPVILAMAKACGGKIAKTYEHDATAWCALTQNYTLISTGFRGNDSLWALDFRKYGVKLLGPAVGAIATKTRDGGGHVFQVVGRTADGKIVGRGGNQDDMVCDETFDPSVLAYNWPSDYPLPKTGMAALPVVKPLPHTKRSVTLPSLNVSPAKPAVVPIPKVSPPKPAPTPIPPPPDIQLPPPKPPAPSKGPLAAALALLLGAIGSAAAAIKSHPNWTAFAVLCAVGAIIAIVIHHKRKSQ